MSEGQASLSGDTRAPSMYRLSNRHGYDPELISLELDRVAGKACCRAIVTGNYDPPGPDEPSFVYAGVSLPMASVDEETHAETDKADRLWKEAVKNSECPAQAYEYANASSFAAIQCLSRKVLNRATKLGDLAGILAFHMLSLKLRKIHHGSQKMLVTAWDAIKDGISLRMQLIRENAEPEIVRAVSRNFERTRRTLSREVGLDHPDHVAFSDAVGLIMECDKMHTENLGLQAQGSQETKYRRSLFLSKYELWGMAKRALAMELVFFKRFAMEQTNPAMREKYGNTVLELQKMILGAVEGRCGFHDGKYPFAQSWTDPAHV